MRSLHQLIYQSQSLVPFEAPELRALLAQSRRHNGRCGITGVLLYTPDGRFLQVLEGEEHAVRDLYHHIAQDPRHACCRVLDEGPSAKRSFAHLSMGFRAAQACTLRNLLGSVPADGPAWLVPRPHTHAELLALLEEYMSVEEDLPWMQLQ